MCNTTKKSDTLLDERGILAQVKCLRFRDQAVWFLNSTDCGKDESMSEEVWNMQHECDRLDKKKGEKGSYLDEFSAHRLLESHNDPLTISEMRNALRNLETDCDTRKVTLSELLIYKYKVDWRKAVSQKFIDLEKQRQAEDKLAKAKVSLEEAITSSKQAETDVEQMKVMEENALAEEKQSAEAVEDSKNAEKLFVEAQNAANVSLEELETQEKNTRLKIQKLKHLQTDPKLGIVKRNKAKAELDIMLSADPLPLRTAKISQEASVKKLKKATERARKAKKDAELCLQKSQLAREEAKRARVEALKTAKIAESKIPEARNALEEVQYALDRLISDQKSGKGTIFYLEKELQEAKRYLPKQQFLSFADSKGSSPVKV